MGGTFDSGVLKVEGHKLQSAFKELQENLRYQYGHSGYTGTLAECVKLTITGEVFDTPQQAWAWLQDNTTKWEGAKAVTVKDMPGYYVGGWCSS